MTAPAPTLPLTRPEREALAKLRTGWRLVSPGSVVIESPRAHTPERETFLREAIETFADELYAEHEALRESWHCPACHQVARVRRRTVTTVARYVSTIRDGSDEVHSHRPDQGGATW